MSIEKGSQDSASKFTTIYDTVVQKIPLPGIKLEENVYVEMRDGIKLAVDIYRPETEGRYPAILSKCIYLKEIQQQHPMLSHSIEAGATAFYVPTGYIHVICQARGAGMSQGKWEFLGTKEQEDGYDVIEWIARQPWCDGNVGMIGDSYWAWIQYLVAAQQPPHLKCIVPHDGGTDMFRGSFYRGGMFHDEFANVWINDAMRQCAWPGPLEGKLPPTHLAFDVASHPFDGPYWWERGAWTKADKIKVPVLFFVPLTTLHSQSQLAIYNDIKAPKKLIVEPEGGTAAHYRFITNRAVNEQILRWLDYWLKGKDTGIMDEPEVAIFDSGTQEWRYEHEYPLKRTQWTKLFLHSEGIPTQGVETQYGTLMSVSPLNEKPDKYKLPQANELLMKNKPVLAYATEPLKQDIKIWGPLSLTLYGSSTSRDTAWFLRLIDISPDDKARMLSRGILRASYREVDETRSKPGQPFHPFQKALFLEPGKIYEFQIDIWPIFHTFKEGHRIRLEIASEDFTYIADLHTLDMIRLPVPAENAVYHNADYPSHLLLPVIPEAPIIKPVEPPVSEIKWDLITSHRWAWINNNWRLVNQSK